MGLLSAGTPLSWTATLPYHDRIRHDGITQFLNAYHQAKHYANYDLKWGDELEYLLMQTDHDNRKTTLLLNAPTLLAQLQQPADAAATTPNAAPTLWHPEWAAWMLEGTPGIPYRAFAADLLNVERNMVLRRTQIQRLLRPNQSVHTMTLLPTIGVGVHTTPLTLPYAPIERSLFVGDGAVNPAHPRFATISANIRARRQIRRPFTLPLFKDTYTSALQPLVPADDTHRGLIAQSGERPVEEQGPTEWEKKELHNSLTQTCENVIAMDSLAFGMGSCCLQITMQGRDMDESRHLYDQLAVVAPLMLALTAATPAIRGLLADTDVRWDVISGAMDDRTNDEIDSGRIPKSRYSSIDCFLSSREQLKPESYNDLPVPINEEAYKRLVSGGVDHLLAQHIAHLFIRDPIVVYEEKLDQDNMKSTDHFENIQSTNWNTVRFKLPPPGSKGIGWRTEFRPMEVGLTDFENAAFSVFMVILSRVILAFNLDFYVPMSKVDANMRIAHRRDAVRSQRFYFRKNVFPPCSDGSRFLYECGHIPNANLVGAEGEDTEKLFDYEDSSSMNGSAISSGSSNCWSGSECDEKTPFELMTMDEIFNGKPLCRNGQQEGYQFPGLIPLMRGYLDALDIDRDTRAHLVNYLDFVSQRASGKLLTNATYIRNFIRTHPKYRHDSIVNDEICYDLINHLQAITNREINAPELLGDFYNKSLGVEEAQETAKSMMMRMQNEPKGHEATQLDGSEMPRALRSTIYSIAKGVDDNRCKDC